MPFRKDKLHQRRSNSPLNEKQSSFEVGSAFKRSHFPLNSKCPQNTTLPLSPSPAKVNTLLGWVLHLWEDMSMQKVDQTCMCWIVVSQFRQLCVMLRIGRRSLFLATALQPALPQSPSPAQTQAPTQSPRQQDCQSARGGHSCLFSESHGGGFNIFASGTTLIDGSLKLCTSCIDLENCRQTWHKETENWKKTADVGMHEERSECSLVFSINFDLCDLLPTFSSVSSIYAYIGPHVF